MSPIFPDKVNLCIVSETIDGLLRYTSCVAWTQRSHRLQVFLESDAFHGHMHVFRHTCALTPSNQHRTTIDTNAILR